MKCRDAYEMMNSYFDNKIDPMTDRQLAEHINSCPKCRAELDFLISYRNILKGVKPVPPPDNFLSELRRRIESEKSENPVKRITDTLKIFLSNYNFHIEAAGVLAVAALVFFLYRPFFNESIPERTSEYAIESPRSETAVKKDALKNNAVSDGKADLKDMPSVSREIPPGGEKAEERTSGYNIADDNIAEEAESTYDSSELGMMKKSRSALDEKSAPKKEAKEDMEYDAASIKTKGALTQQEYSREVSGSDIENILLEFNANIIKKDLSRKDGLYYMLKVKSDKHISLIKRIKMKYIIEEKIVKKSRSYYEIELFLKKKKN